MWWHWRRRRTGFLCGAGLLQPDLAGFVVDGALFGRTVVAATAVRHGSDCWM